MTSRPPKNVAASVRARLLNRSRQTGEDFNFVLQRYAAERFLYRLGESPYRDQFVLKGAMLFALWGGSIYRPTRDLDFTGYGNSEPDAVLQSFREICAVDVEDDGMVFNGAELKAEPIRGEDDYGGLRLVCPAKLGTAEICMQVDIGFGNAIEPAPTDAEYPTLLDGPPPPRIRAYPHEAVVAEKFHAMVVLGEINSRFKDYYDLYVLAQRFPFSGDPLSRAIKATFARRRTLIVAELPAPLTPRFYTDGSRAGGWRTYLTRSAVPGAPADWVAVGELLQAFLGPPWNALGNGRAFLDSWPAGGPWTPPGPSKEPRA